MGKHGKSMQKWKAANGLNAIARPGMIEELRQQCLSITLVSGRNGRVMDIWNGFLLKNGVPHSVHSLINHHHRHRHRRHHHHHHHHHSLALRHLHLPFGRYLSPIGEQDLVQGTCSSPAANNTREHGLHSGSSHPRKPTAPQCTWWRSPQLSGEGLLTVDCRWLSAKFFVIPPTLHLQKFNVFQQLNTLNY